MITLGDKVRDKISGLEGIAVERREFLNGCVQFSVQPPMKKGAIEIPSWYIDEEQLEVIGKGAAVKKKSTGGPMSKTSVSRAG